MNANEIIVGKDYIIKIAHNNVKVKVLSHSGHSWVVKTVGGKIMPVQMADRFVRQVDHVPAPVTIPAPTEPQEPQAPAAEVVAESVTSPAPVPPAVPTEPATPQAATQDPPPVASTPAASEKKLSMLDAAAQVLKDAGYPMKINDILEAMQTTGIWKPGLGKTPDRTIVAAIGIEQRRKPNPRFRKTAPGTFEYIGGQENE